jgi:predicted O-methyltransferase YrrM
VSRVEAISRIASIPGFLVPGDAEKLYEIAHAAQGPILEIGTYHGKSTVLMALAIKDAGAVNVVYTLEVDKAFIRAAEAQAIAHGVADSIVFVRGTLHAFARAYPGLRPAVAFVDGDHRRAGVEADLVVLRRLVPAGGVLLFHDFAAPSNDDPRCNEIKVRPAVEASWVARECEFQGIYGCSGLFTRRTWRGVADETTVVDLLPLASPRDQYRHRLRYPAGRVWKRLRGVQGLAPVTDEASASDL